MIDTIDGLQPVILSILQGYNGSIIAYGQTGTGKTYTIEGGTDENRGIIPRASEEIFTYIETQTDKSSKFLVRAAFLQVRSMPSLTHTRNLFTHLDLQREDFRSPRRKSSEARRADVPESAGKRRRYVP